MTNTTHQLWMEEFLHLQGLRHSLEFTRESYLRLDMTNHSEVFVESIRKAQSVLDQYIQDLGISITALGTEAEILKTESEF